MQEARAAIVRELELNRKLLASDEHLPHHRRLHDIYESMERTGRTDEVHALFRSGVHIPPLRDEAWRTFMASEVSGGLPFAERAMLATIYGHQANLEGLFQHMLANVTQPTADRERPEYMRDMVRVIDLTLTDVVITETRLDAAYAAAIAQLSRGST